MGEDVMEYKMPMYHDNSILLVRNAFAIESNQKQSALGERLDKTRYIYMYAYINTCVCLQH